MANVTIIIDGIETSFDLDENGETILTTALDNGVDAPFSCRGGVCTTCKARLLEGTVHMDANYALTNNELKQGYILACQSHPTSGIVKITWDV